MKKIIINLSAILSLSLTLFVITKTLEIPHKEYFENPGSFLYAEGNAPVDIRNEILDKLAEFQAGYVTRDTSILDSYMNSIFSKENVLILGTMPNEYLTDYATAFNLIRSDWLYWGDVKLLIEQSNISVKGNVAWFATIGYVEFDLSRFLVLPLRVTGILVNEDNSWKFQQVQYQFDLDITMVLITIILLFLIIAIMLTRLVIIIIRVSRGKVLET